MKQKIIQYVDEQADTIKALGSYIFNTPELGFKEFKTKKILVDNFLANGITIEKEYFQTGFQVSIGQGKPHIGLIAELDAIPTASHPSSDPETHAAHSCGHSTQTTIMSSALIALHKLNITNHFPGKITLFFTPAEEFTDIASRREMIKEDKIKYLSGKENMLADHIFDDVDLLIHLHASGEYKGYHFSVNSTLAGFIYKTFTFSGKAAHAAVLPHEGINALNAFALFQSAAAMLRETYKDEDMVRFHGILTHGGDTVNTIPDKVVYEAYIRASDSKALLDINEQLTNCAINCAKALGAECTVKDTPGYLPLDQDRNLSAVLYQNLLQFTDKDQIRTNEKSVAAGDVGDISLFKPLIQYGHTGFSGNIHGKDLMISDEDEVYLTQTKIIAMTVYDLLSKPELVDQIVKSFKPKITYQEYIDYLQTQ